MITPKLSIKVSDVAYLSAICIGNFGAYTAKLRYMCINGVKRWQGDVAPRSWSYAK